MRTYQLLIGGRWLDAASGRTFDDLNPATGEVLAAVAEADREDVHRALAAARAAFEGGPWARMSGGERGRILLRIADLLEREADAIARLESQDNGRPIRETSAPGWADKIEGETIPVEGPYLNYTVRVAIGVVGQITPWNHPLLIATKKVAPALAAGNPPIVTSTNLPQGEGYAPDRRRHVDFLTSYPVGDMALGELRGPMPEETHSWLNRVALGVPTQHATAREGHNRLNHQGH